jgi:hypothetical protein
MFADGYPAEVSETSTIKCVRDSMIASSYDSNF